MTLKVLHLVHSFQTGGAEGVVLNLIRFGAPGIDNFVCSLTEPNDLAAALESPRVGFSCLKKRSGNDLSILPRLARLIDDERIDVVHSQGWGTYIEGLIAAKLMSRRRPRFLFAFHGKSMDDVVHGIPWRRRLAQRVAVAFTDACIAPAAHMASDFAKSLSVSPRKIEVIYNGIDTARFAPGRDPFARASLGLNDSHFVIGFVGRLDPVKNLDGAIETFARFRAALSERDAARVRLLIVGDGAERAALGRAVVAAGLESAVLFAGLRSDVSACMSAMDAYFQPSLYEGHSLTLLEAMATGLPVLSSAVGGTPEIIVDGETGFLREPRDYEGMARVLADLYAHSELREQVGKRARTRITRDYGVAAMVARYERLYEHLTGSVQRPCVE
jgi:sugar transferase (PEP-CTERM/EpsH1 system associated)